MCLSDEKTMTTISAVDPDLPPYSAPFQYELMEDDGMEGKWKLEPINGTVPEKQSSLNVSFTICHLKSR